MKQAVRDAFIEFNAPFEGRLRFMYLDQLGLVTTGVGNLIDPMPLAFPLPWRKPDGTLATRNEVAAAWMAVKARKDLAPQGGGHFGGVTDLRLTDADVDALIFARLGQMERVLRTWHPCWDSLPADAQLAITSMSWAMGPAFRYPNFWAAIERGDYVTAVAEGTIHPEEGTIVHRNEANRALLRNAGAVIAQKMDPEKLYWPADVSGA